MFTEREKQIIELIAKGFTSVAISKILIISIDTVKTHRKNIIRKAKAGGLQFDSLLRLAIQNMNKNTP